LEVQVVGPKKTDVLRMTGLSQEKTTLQIPIPPSIDKNGGSFETEIGQSLQHF
jgi:nucleoporin POM152